VSNNEKQIITEKWNKNLVVPQHEHNFFFCNLSVKATSYTNSIKKVEYSRQKIYVIIACWDLSRLLVLNPCNNKNLCNEKERKKEIQYNYKYCKEKWNKPRTQINKSFRIFCLIKKEFKILLSSYWQPIRDHYLKKRSRCIKPKSINYMWEIQQIT